MLHLLGGNNLCPRFSLGARKLHGLYEEAYLTDRSAHGVVIRKDVAVADTVETERADGAAIARDVPSSLRTWVTFSSFSAIVDLLGLLLPADSDAHALPAGR